MAVSKLYTDPLRFREIYEQGLEDAEDDGDFYAGVQSGYSGLKSSTKNAGAALARTFGADETADRWEQESDLDAARAAGLAHGRPTFETLAKDFSPGKLADWLQFAAGQQAPLFAEMGLSSLVGGAAGALAGGPPGAVAGAGAGLARSMAPRVGRYLGTYLPYAAATSGENYGQLRHDEEATGTPRQQALASLLTGGTQALIGTAFGPEAMLAKAAGPAKLGLRGALKEIGTQSVGEGLGETTEQLLGHAVHKYGFNPNKEIDPMQLAEAFATGTAIGGMYSAPFVGIQQAQLYRQARQKQRLTEELNTVDSALSALNGLPEEELSDRAKEQREFLNKYRDLLHKRIDPNNAVQGAAALAGTSDVTEQDYDLNEATGQVLLPEQAQTNAGFKAKLQAEIDAGRAYVDENAVYLTDYAVSPDRDWGLIATSTLDGADKSAVPIVNADRLASITTADQLVNELSKSVIGSQLIQDFGLAGEPEAVSAAVATLTGGNGLETEEGRTAMIDKFTAQVRSEPIYNPGSFAAQNQAAQSGLSERLANAVASNQAVMREGLVVLTSPELSSEPLISFEANGQQKTPVLNYTGLARIGDTKQLFNRLTENDAGLQLLGAVEDSAGLERVVQALTDGQGMSTLDGRKNVARFLANVFSAEYANRVAVDPNRSPEVFAQMLKTQVIDALGPGRAKAAGLITSDVERAQLSQQGVQDVFVDDLITPEEGVAAWTDADGVYRKLAFPLKNGGTSVIAVPRSLWDLIVKKLPILVDGEPVPRGRILKMFTEAVQGKSQIDPVQLLKNARLSKEFRTQSKPVWELEIIGQMYDKDGNKKPLSEYARLKETNLDSRPSPLQNAYNVRMAKFDPGSVSEDVYQDLLEGLITLARDSGFVLVGRMDKNYYFAAPQDALRLFRDFGVMTTGRKNQYNATQIADDINVLERIGVLLKKQSGYQMTLDLSRFADTKNTTRHDDKTNDGTVAIMDGVPLAQGVMVRTVTMKDGRKELEFDKGMLRPPLALREWSVDPETGELNIKGQLGEYEKQSLNEALQLGRRRKPLDTETEARFFRMFPPAAQRNGVLNLQQVLFGLADSLTLLHKDTLSRFGDWTLDLELTKDAKEKAKAGVPLARLIDENAVLKRLAQLFGYTSRAYVLASDLVKEPGQVVLLPETYNEFNKGWRETHGRDLKEGDEVYLHRDPALPDATSVSKFTFTGVASFKAGNTNRGIVVNPKDPNWLRAAGDFDGDSGVLIVPTKDNKTLLDTLSDPNQYISFSFNAGRFGSYVKKGKSAQVRLEDALFKTNLSADVLAPLVAAAQPARIRAMKTEKQVLSFANALAAAVVPRSSPFSTEIGLFARMGQKLAELGQLNTYGMFPNPKYEGEYPDLPFPALLAMDLKDVNGQPGFIEMKLGEAIALVAQTSISAKKKDYKREAVRLAIDALRVAMGSVMRGRAMVNPANPSSLLPRFGRDARVIASIEESERTGNRYLAEARKPLSFLVSLFGNVRSAPPRRKRTTDQRASNVDTLDFDRMRKFESLRWDIRRNVNKDDFDESLVEQLKDFFAWTPSHTKREQQRQMIDYASWLLQMMYNHLAPVHNKPEYREAKAAAFEALRRGINQRITEYNRAIPQGATRVSLVGESTSQTELFRLWAEAPYNGLSIGTPIEMTRFMQTVYGDPDSQSAIQAALRADEQESSSEYPVYKAWMFEAPLHIELAFRALEHNRVVQELRLLESQYHLPTLLKSKATVLAGRRPDPNREKDIATSFKTRYAALTERLQLLLAESPDDPDDSAEVDMAKAALSEIAREAELAVILGVVSPEAMIAHGSETLAINILSPADFTRISSEVAIDVGVRDGIVVGLDDNGVRLPSSLVRPGLYMRVDSTRFDFVTLSEDGELVPVRDPATGSIVNVNSPGMQTLAEQTGGIVYLGTDIPSGFTLRQRNKGEGLADRQDKKMVTMIVKSPFDDLTAQSPNLNRIPDNKTGTAIKEAIQSGKASFEINTVYFNVPLNIPNNGLQSFGKDSKEGPVYVVDPYSVGGTGRTFRSEQLHKFFVSLAGFKYFASFFRPSVNNVDNFIDLLLSGTLPSDRTITPFVARAQIANFMTEVFRLDAIYQPGLDAAKIREMMIAAAQNLASTGNSVQQWLVERLRERHIALSEREANKRRVGATFTWTGQYKYDVPFLREMYAEKAWTAPKVEGVIPLNADAFASETEFLKFIALHESYHELRPNHDGDIPQAENENRANAFAMSMLATPEDSWNPTSKRAWDILKQAVNETDDQQTYPVVGAAARAEGPTNDGEPSKGTTRDRFIKATSIERPGVREKLYELARKVLNLIGLDSVPIIVGNPGAMFDAIQAAEEEFGALPEHIAKFRDDILNGKANEYRGYTFGYHGTYFVWVNDNSNKTVEAGQLNSTTLAAFVHELGHVIKYAAYDNASPDVKEKVQKAYETWKGTKKDADKYAVDFDEWMADQIAAWAMTDKQPLTVAEQFFSNVAKALKSLWTMFRRLNLDKGKVVLEASVVDFIKSINRPNMRGSSTAPKGDTLPPPVTDSSMASPEEIEAQMEALRAEAEGRRQADEAAQAEQERLAAIAARRLDRFAKIQNWAMNGGWGDLKELQAIADEVEAGLNDMLAPQDVKVLTEMAANRIMQRRLAGLLGTSPEILRALRNPNKAVAYMYILSVSGMMVPPDPVRGPFKTLQDVLMAHSSNGLEALTSDIIEAIAGLNANAGQNLGPNQPPLFPPNSPAARLYKEQTARYVQGMTGMIQRGYELYRKLTSWMIDVPYQRLLDTQNPTLIHFARSVQEMAWDLGVLKPAGYVERTHVLYQIEANKASKILKDLTEEEREMLRMRLWQQSTKSNANVDKAYNEIRKLLTHLLQYESRGGLEVPGRNDYWPMILNHEYITSEIDHVVRLYTSNEFLRDGWNKVREDYKEWLTKAGYPESDVERIDAMPLDAFVKSYLLEDSENGLPGWGLKQRGKEKIHTPGFRFMNPRKLDFLLRVKASAPNDAGAAKIQESILETLESDPNKILHRYIRSSIKRTEYAVLMTTIGGTEGWAGMVARAKAQGATDADIELAVKYMDAVLGQSGIVERDSINSFIDKHGDTFPFLKKFKASEGQIMNPYLNNMRSFLLMWQAISKLALSAFASFIDPFGQLLHHGDFKLFLQSMRTTYQGLRQLAHASPEAVKMYKTILESGSLEEAMTHEDLMSTYFGPEVRPWAQNIMTKFFTINGVQWITQKTRHMATSAGLIALKDWKLAAEQGDARAIQSLAEHGLTAEDILLDEDGDVIITPEEDVEAHTPEGERAIRVHAALFRFVNESQIRPDPTNRTLMGSNPYYALVTQWKNFIVAFDNQLLRPAMYRASEEGRWAPVMFGALTMIPVMLFADMLRDALKTSMDDDDDNWRPSWKDNWTLQEHIMYAIQRAGFYGRHELVYDIMEQLQKGDVPRAATEILGPASSDVRQIAQEGFQTKMLPAADLWKDWG